MENIADVEYARGLRVCGVVGSAERLAECAKGGFQVLEALQGFFGGSCSQV